jgi:hypothetical protein
MIVDDQLRHNEDFFKQCMDVMRPKAKDYATDNIVFIELLRESWEIKSRPQTVLWILLRKHLSALRNYAVNGKVESESVNSRLIDIANEMALMHILSNYEINVYVDAIDYVTTNEKCEGDRGECHLFSSDEECDRCGFLNYLNQSHKDLVLKAKSSQSIQRQLDFSRGQSEMSKSILGQNGNPI